MSGLFWQLWREVDEAHLREASLTEENHHLRERIQELQATIVKLVNDLEDVQLRLILKEIQEYRHDYSPS